MTVAGIPTRTIVPPGLVMAMLVVMESDEPTLDSASGAGVRTFAAATELVARLDLGRLVSARYPLARFADAIDHAAHAGARGAVKIAFAPQEKLR